MKLPVPLGVPDRFDGDGRPLPPEPSWADYLTAWVHASAAPS